MRIRQAFVALALTAIAQPQASAATRYDVVVIGGTPAGIAAAIAAGRMGKRVMLVEQAPVLGGVISSGLTLLDDAPIQSNSGVFEEFRQRVGKYHRTEFAHDPVVKQHLANPPSRWNLAEGQAWEPKTVARIYAEMVAEVPTIMTRFNEVPVTATVKGDRVVAVTTQDRDNQGRLGVKHHYAGRVIIDATYEGDVAAFAGVPFRIGREARSEEEPHAGVVYTDAFCEGEKALPGTILPGSTGQSDDRLQAFTFRLIGKNYGRAEHPHRMRSPPPHYDPAQYQWHPSIKPWLPNGKLEFSGINWASDWAGLSTRYVLAGWEEREKIATTFLNYALGRVYYLQTEGGSPQYGLADDEFTDNNHLPYRLYVREGRRIEGLYTLTESDLHRDLRGNGLRGPLHAQAVAIGTYPIDSHNVQNPTDRSSPCSGEGALFLWDAAGPYQIPYGVMVPRNRKGLLVPVAISSTHVAISAVRMEPIWSSLGQAAGVAAALALNSPRELKDVSVPDIQQALLQQCSTLFFYMDMPCDAPVFEAVQRLSLLGAVDGDENYYFRPDQPVTLAEFARMAVKGLAIPLSITAKHFSDVPREHPAFKYIETLYDYSTRSAEPFLSYEVRDYLSYWWGAQTLKGPPAFIYPDQTITGRFATRIISGLLQKTVPASQAPDRILTRGEAVRLIDGLRGEVGRPRL